jgi:hypothetical protein
MAYSGKFKPKNVDKYMGDYTNIVYRSMWERHCFKWCDENPMVVRWSSEETVIPYFYDVDKKYHRYFVDLKIVMGGGSTFLIEIKPQKETEPPKRPDRSKRYISESLTYVKNMNKWEAASKYAQERGWKFQIWTEDTLKQMGIMTKDLPKTIKPMKKMKPLRVKKKTL